MKKISNTQVLKVTSSETGQRLDIWIDKHIPSLSRSRIQDLIKSEYITVDSQSVNKHKKITEGMEVEINIPPVVSTKLIAENIPLDILYEDSDIIVINKPAGLVVHPAVGHFSGTLVNALLYHCHDIVGISGELRPGIVHRLDKDTTGAIVAVKNDVAMKSMVSQFKRGLVYKKYLALVMGNPPRPEGKIETLIGRNTHNRKKMSATPASGKIAYTQYQVIENFNNASLLGVTIQTGRTHQIRVHMSYIGNPIIGDTQYGRRNFFYKTDLLKVNRQMLHAEILTFRHPRTKKNMEFRAPIADDMKKLLENLRKTG